MTAGGSKSRYTQEEADRQLEQDLIGLQGFKIPNEMQQDPVSYWASQLERAINTYNKSSAKESQWAPEKAKTDLLGIINQVQQLNIQNVKELGAKIKRSLTALKKNIETPGKSNKVADSQILLHLANLNKSVKERLQGVEERCAELDTLKDICKKKSLNPICLAQLRSMQDTGKVILGHIFEQSDYLSKQEKNQIHKFVMDVMAEAQNILNENSPDVDVINQIKALHEYLKEEPLAAKHDMDDFYYKTRKNVASRLRKTLDYSQLEKHHKEMEGKVEDCLKSVVSEFSAMNNKFFDKKESMIAQLSTNEFIKLSQDFSREWALRAKPQHRRSATEQGVPTLANSLPAHYSFYSEVSLKKRQSSVLPIINHRNLPRGMTGGGVAKEEVRYRKKS